MSAEHVGVSLQNLGFTANTLENYSYVKNKFVFKSDSILEINDYYSNRSSRNVRFTELCETVNTLSNQAFAGLDKFRLRTSLEKIKECV